MLLNPSQESRLNFNCAAGLHFEKVLNLLNTISSSAEQRVNSSSWLLGEEVESGRKTVQSGINRKPTPALSTALPQQHLLTVGVAQLSPLSD